MSIRIDGDKCVGCLKCVDVCPGTLISEKSGKAYMKYPDLCWGCVSCVKECNVGAIKFFLGADIGGRGSSLNVKKDGDILHWNIEKYDGTKITVDVNSKNSNKY
ncbi:MAG: 4Fe-4S binding protein [Ruminococcus sp.]|nr:4Fe-4S binding protein [Ruminococcus sp.]MDY3896155.1 4Fe-4S dicluster domain-containing protein [Candidatus Fimenecus sp.]